MGKLHKILVEQASASAQLCQKLFTLALLNAAHDAKEGLVRRKA